MFEYLLVFSLGLFLGLSYDDITVEKKEKIEYKKQKLIIQRIQEDYESGYEPDFALYKKIYMDSKN
jgi:hypothetical protein